MESEIFKQYRTLLGKTQKDLAVLLGVSLKAISSYEQGWRAIPGHVERQLLYLLSHRRNAGIKFENCWKIQKCPKEKRKACPAWEFRSGAHCWVINGTICHGKVFDNWEEKIAKCYECEVLQRVLAPPIYYK